MVYHNTVLVRGGHGHTINFGLKCVTYFFFLAFATNKKLWSGNMQIFGWKSTYYQIIPVIFKILKFRISCKSAGPPLILVLCNFSIFSNIIIRLLLSYLWLCLSTLLLLFQCLSLWHSLWINHLGCNGSHDHHYLTWYILYHCWRMIRRCHCINIQYNPMYNLNTLSATTQRFMNMIYWHFVQRNYHFLSKKEM